MTGQTQTIDHAPDSFADNRLLRTLPDSLRQRLAGQAEVIRLDEGDTVVRSGSELTRSLFPLGATTISLNAELEGGRSIEVASIGSEGAIGGIVSCGKSAAFARADTLVGGEAVCLPMQALEDAKGHSAHLRNIFCRYSDYLLAQIMQSVACNSFHSIDQRAARWLLTESDRAGPKLRLTQESLSKLLGVQRTTLNATVRQLQESGAVEIRRGSIEVLDRSKLHSRSCHCYDAVERFFGDVIGDGGLGGSAECGD